MQIKKRPVQNRWKNCLECTRSRWEETHLQSRAWIVKKLFQVLLWFGFESSELPETLKIFEHLLESVEKNWMQNLWNYLLLLNVRSKMVVEDTKKKTRASQKSVIYETYVRFPNDCHHKHLHYWIHSKKDSWSQRNTSSLITNCLWECPRKNVFSYQLWQGSLFNWI